MCRRGRSSAHRIGVAKITWLCRAIISRTQSTAVGADIDTMSAIRMVSGVVRKHLAEGSQHEVCGAPDGPMALVDEIDAIRNRSDQCSDQGKWS